MASLQPTTKAAPNAKSAKTDILSIPIAWSHSLISLLLVVITYELLWQLNFFYKPLVGTSLLIVLMAIIVLAGFRFGTKPAVAVAVLANVYIFYADAGPGRNVAPISQLIRSEWLALVLLYAPAIIVGYLRERINDLLDQERVARSTAEQEQSRLTTILQQLPVGVVIADATTGQVIFGNQYLEQLLGHPDPQLLATDKINTTNHSSTAALPLQEWPLKQVLAGHVLQSDEYAYSHDGHHHILRVNGTPIFNSQGDITAGVVIIDDITQEREAMQRKDDFISMVSHELKTPLTSLKMYIQLSSRQFQNPIPGLDVASTMAKADAQADKLTQMVTDMLALARTQSSQVEYHYEDIDIYALLVDIINDFKTTNPSHAIELIGVPGPSVEADPERIGQVVVNLISNAIKYSPQADSVIINVKQDKKSIVISVHDFGIGIAPSDKKKIFERFYQAPDANGRTFPGLGVGLYLCAEIIRHHHGRIWLESKRGVGSTFFVSLPIQQPKIIRK